MSETSPPNLEERLRALEARIARSEDHTRVINIMGYYSYFNTSHRFRELLEFWALEDPDVWLDIDNMARWVGGEKIRRFLLTQDVDPIPNPALPLDLAPSRGQMHEHTLTTPVIEVAEDGQTAQGLWVSPGHETVNNTAYWAWCKYAVDFKKIDGAWKIWHLKVHGTFFTPYNKDWIETAQRAPTETEWARDAGAQAAAPWQYSGEDIPPPLPVPKPYKDWASRGEPGRGTTAK